MLYMQILTAFSLSSIATPFYFSQAVENVLWLENTARSPETLNICSVVYIAESNVLITELMQARTLGYNRCRQYQSHARTID